MTRHRDERGLAAPIVITLTGLVLILAVVVAALGRVLVDQRRVSLAADLAALAAAGAIQSGSPACSAARTIAGRNGASLVACVVSGDRVRVRTALEAPTLLNRTIRLEADAHAGPVGEAP